MLFTSRSFLFIFLPLLLLLYYALRSGRQRNLLLLVGSLLFYAWGEPAFIWVMLGSVAINYLLALACAPDSRHRKLAVTAGLVFNVGLLFIFKYLAFVLHNANLMWIASSDIEIALPIGISFFTFQEISYLLDVYRGTAPPRKNILDVALYVSLFPQLIAGPIVRFPEIIGQIDRRQESFDRFVDGLELFIVGLSKKVLIANVLGRVADDLFGQPATELSAVSAWCGAVAYTLQIYFDFSGYSDMAIGLGKLFGFELPVNFNYPYISRSISEFWRRWHITLGSWFRDYVYFPLGGSRCSKSRTVFNLAVVWALTGIWHGANWTFLLWGVYFMVLIIMEKLLGGLVASNRMLRISGHFYFVIAVILGWVLFRSSSISGAVDYLVAMFDFSGKGDDSWKFYLSEFKAEYLAGILLSMPVYRRIRQWRRRPMVNLLWYGWLVFLFSICCGAIAKSSYNPFIYFNF